MRWRLSLRAAHVDAPATRSAGARVRWALAGSLLVHGALAWMFFSKEAPTPTPVSESVEIAFEVAPAAAPAPDSPAASTAAPSPARGPSLASRSRAKAAVAHGHPAKAEAEAAEGLAPKNEGSVPATGAASPGLVNPLATFQPAHPNLTGSMRFPLPGEKARDVLAAPMAKGPTGVREPPKGIKGGAGVTAAVAEDGSIRFQDPKDISNVHIAGLGLGGDFDLNDQIMKRAGQDPYAAVKRDMAENTREQRLCMARRYQGERQKQELFALSTKVRHIAARTDMSAAQRRGLLFAIWDECSEESDSTTDYGAMARATILSIVREAFPAGSDVAYSPAELLALNERRSSRQPFAPYDPRPMKRTGHPDAAAPMECP
jgi:hypothetical protein